MRKHRESAPSKKTLSQRLGEVNVMPNGMLDPIDPTDLAILNITKESPNKTKRTRKK